MLNRRNAIAWAVRFAIVALLLVGVFLSHRLGIAQHAIPDNRPCYETAQGYEKCDSGNPYGFKVGLVCGVVLCLFTLGYLLSRQK